MRKDKIVAGAVCGTAIVALLVTIKKQFDKLVKAKILEIVKAELENENNTKLYNTEELDLESDFEPEIRFPQMPNYVTNEMIIKCSNELMDFISGEKNLRDFSCREKIIVECLLYKKLKSLPGDPHENNETWFIASNLSKFTAEMKKQSPIIYWRLRHLADNYMVNDWVSHAIRFFSDGSLI